MSGLVVKNSGLFVKVKLWKLQREVSSTEKAFGGGQKPVIKVLGSKVFDLVVIFECLVVKIEHLVVIRFGVKMKTYTVFSVDSVYKAH